MVGPSVILYYYDWLARSRCRSRSTVVARRLQERAPTRIVADGTVGETTTCMREILGRMLARFPRKRTPRAATGDAISLFRDAPATTTLAERVVAFLRSPNPLSRRARASVHSLF